MAWGSREGEKMQQKFGYRLYRNVIKIQKCPGIHIYIFFYVKCVKILNIDLMQNYHLFFYCLFILHYIRNTFARKGYIYIYIFYDPGRKCTVEYSEISALSIYFHPSKFLFSSKLHSLIRKTPLFYRLSFRVCV